MSDPGAVTIPHSVDSHNKTNDANLGLTRSLIKLLALPARKTGVDKSDRQLDKTHDNLREFSPLKVHENPSREVRGRSRISEQMENVILVKTPLTLATGRGSAYEERSQDTARGYTRRTLRATSRISIT